MAGANLRDAEKASCRDLTHRLFAVTSFMRVQLMSFLRGEGLATLPELQRLRMQMMFIPILEQSIERRHAMLRQRIQSAHNRSGPYVSLI